MMAINDNRLPRDILTVEQLHALREAGWIVVREDAIRLAQAHAVDEERGRLREVA